MGAAALVTAQTSTRIRRLVQTTHPMIDSLSIIALMAAAISGVRADINGGVLLDPNHFVPGTGSLAGIRMVTDRQGDAVSDDVLLIGSDDGFNIWSLFGTK